MSDRQVFTILVLTHLARHVVIIEALLRGYNDGNDILTLSLGGANGWLEEAGGVVASRIADKGTVVTVAAGSCRDFGRRGAVSDLGCFAGNDGAYGGWYISSPSTGRDVISVASINK